MHKVFLKSIGAIALLVIGTVLSACGLSKQQIQHELKMQFQQKMNGSPIYQDLNITVTRVVLFKRGPHTYEGQVQIQSRSGVSNIGVTVETDGHDILWQENVLDFLPLVGAELLKELIP